MRAVRLRTADKVAFLGRALKTPPPSKGISSNGASAECGAPTGGVGGLLQV